MLKSIILLVIGIALLVKGADFFVDGAGGIARKLKIPAIIIGLTVVSIGTSLPELSVSVNSAIRHLDDMSFGNVLGSNIFNVLMVVGISALVVPMTVDRSVLKYDLPFLLGIYGLLFIFAYAVTPGELSRWESIVLLALFVAYIVWLVIRARKQKDSLAEEEDAKNLPLVADLVFLVVGACGIIFGGTAVVDSASDIALRLGMSELLVALTIVAVGTSLPELVTSVVAAKKGQQDIAIGNAIGSCIANLLLILGMSSAIYPLSLVDNGLDMVVMVISAILVLVFCVRDRKVNRWQGAIFVGFYAIYLVYIILRNQYPHLALNF